MPDELVPDELVIDPELPAAVQARLRRFPRDRMLPFTTSPREHRPEGRTALGTFVKRLDHFTASGMKAVEAARGRALRREDATAQLSGLADSHLDMVAGLASDGTEQSLLARLSLDLQARIGSLGDAARDQG